MYRFMKCSILLLASGLILAACGQSGALQHPNDPNYDQRAKYLLYSPDTAQPTAASQATTP